MNFQPKGLQSLFKSKLFFTGDPHFDHIAIMRHCNRPYSAAEEMNEDIIHKWNEVVCTGSTVYVIGDFAYKDHRKYFHRLNGKKILIEGNHDKINLETKKLFTEVHPFLRRNFFGRDITLCHYAMKTWANSCHGSWHLYAHSHGRIKEYEDSFSFDIGMDVWNFYPVPFEIVCAKMATKKPKDFYAPEEAEQHVEENRSKNKITWDNYIAINESIQTRDNSLSAKD